MCENVVKQLLQANIKGRIALTDIRTPKLIILSESRLEDVGWELGMDIGFGAAAVTCMYPVYFSKKLLYHRNEGLIFRKCQPRKCQVRCSRAAMKRTCIVTLRHRYFLGADLRSPEGVSHQGLLDAFVSQVSVSPGACVIAIKF